MYTDAKKPSFALKIVSQLSNTQNPACRSELNCRLRNGHNLKGFAMAELVVVNMHKDNRITRFHMS